MVMVSLWFSLNPPTIPGRTASLTVRIGIKLLAAIRNLLNAAAVALANHAIRGLLADKNCNGIVVEAHLCPWSANGGEGIKIIDNESLKSGHIRMFKRIA